MSLEVEIAHVQGAFRLEASFRSDGRLTALFGRSGSGKTTLVRAGPGKWDRRIRWIARTRTIHNVKAETVYG